MMTRRDRGTRVTRRGALVLTAAIPLVAGLIAGAPAGAADQAAGSADVVHYNGTIDGADYRAAVPADWNGTLILYSHGFIPPVFDDPVPIALSTSPKTEERLLDEGYALAASRYQGDGTGWQLEGGRDQLKLLDWFDENIGEPQRTISSGLSMGGQIAVNYAERHPDRFDGVLAQCADYDTNGILNASLDMTFAIKTLLAPDAEIDLVRPDNPAVTSQNLQEAITTALETPEGRARIALAAALGGIQGWYSGVEPRPTTPEEEIRQQARWLHDAYSTFVGPLGRPQIEAVAGGNPSWNVGINYRRQFARSGQRDLAVWAYREAGLSLKSDLDALRSAPRVAPDPPAVAYFYRHGVARGRTPAPVVSLHSTADGGAIVDQQGWYTSQVRRNGDKHKLRSLYIERGGHCAFSAADELVALRILLERVESGRWSDTAPETLNAEVEEYGPDYHQVYDFSTDQTVTMPPAFTDFTPSRFLRPSL